MLYVAVCTQLLECCGGEWETDYCTEKIIPRRLLGLEGFELHRGLCREAAAQDWGNWQLQGQDGQDARFPICEGRPSELTWHGTYALLKREF